MLMMSQNHHVVTRRSRVTSLLVTPMYVMVSVLFVWCFYLHTELKVANMERGKHDKDGLNERRKRSAESSTKGFLNMLPGASNLLYDMELEPCGGAVFTVWGRSICPEETEAELVYNGIVGGTNVDSSGGGVDYLCLSRHPQWVTPSSSTGTSQSAATSGSTYRRRTNHNDVTDTKNENTKTADKPCSTSVTSATGTVSPTSPQRPPESEEDATRVVTREELLSLLLGSAGDVAVPNTSTSDVDKDAYLYGAEYQGNQVQFRHDNLAADTFVDQDAVCAVCRSKLRLSAVMIPGRRECYAGWTKEYEGFLMSGPVGVRAQHRFVCVHGAPEAAQGGWRSDGGAVFYHVRAMCGSLPCPTYIQDREVTCVVCTK